MMILAAWCICTRPFAYIRHSRNPRGDMSASYLAYIICSVLSFIPAIVLHEASHAFAAYKLGDQTAKGAGRLSFNPLRHIDPFGTVILPLILMAMNMPVFGYAKPVPYNPRYFKDPRKGDLIVGLAGPLANLLMALLAALVGWLLVSFAPIMQWIYASVVFRYFFLYFLPLFALINLYLMFFNLLPIPPLDGSSIFAFFLPEKYLPKYYQVQQYAFPVFMIVVILLPQFMRVDPFSWYLSVTAGNVYSLLFPYMG